jgi:hypothetical protein
LLSSSKILELEEELKVVGNNMKSLEVSEQEVKKTNPQFISNIYLFLGHAT